MPRLSLWNSGKKGADYRFFDRTISEFFGMGGTAVYIHKYLGPYQQDYALYNPDGSPIPALPTTPSTTVASGANERSIQDVLFLENRDRQYDTTIYELRGIYSVADTDFDLKQFGLFLTGDTLFIEFHLNDMVALIGRKLMSGDVIELPHQRDDFLLNGGPSINKFYTVEDASRASDGYSATWYPHIWRIKVSPMVASQETQDILDQQATNPLGFDQGKLGDLISSLGTNMGLNEAVVDDAVANFKRRYFETQQYYFVPGSETAGENPWVFAGDGIPPNGAVLLGSGRSFPDNPVQGDYYLRTDYDPNALFMRDGSKWKMQELDWRQAEWSVAHRYLKDFINNDSTTTLADGTVQAEKTNLSKAVKPRADF